MNKLYFSALTLTSFLILSALFTHKTIAQALEGDYTINASEATAGNNFASFTDFAEALSSEGISGHVNASVVVGSGPYNEQVDIANVDGSGPEAVIHLIGNGETLTAVTDTDNRYLLRLSHMSHVVIDDLHLLRDTESTSGFYGVHVFGSGSNITIQNCSADMPGTTSTLVGAYIVSGSETSILAAGDFHDIQIINNTSNGGGYGASVYGELGNLSTNIVIDGNQFENFNSNGVYLRESDGAVVSNNHFDRNAGTVSSCNAIQLAQNANINGRIFNNIIEHTQNSNGTMTFRGIYVFNGTGHMVYNNVIHNILLESGNATGIEVRTGGIAPTISFNTIRFDHDLTTSGNLYGIKEELSNTNSVLRNNIVSIEQITSGNAAALVLGATSVVTTALDSDYNNLFVPDGNVALRGVFTPTFYPTLLNWQNVSQQDQNSFAIDPEFSAMNNSVPTNSAMNDLGITIPGIETDIEGTMRSDPPDVGAYEFEDCDPPVSGPIVGNEVVCAGEVTSYFINTIPGNFSFEWSVTGDATIQSGQGSSQITVEFGTGEVVISVTTEDSCGVGPPSVLQVNVNPLPEVTLNLPQDNICLELSSIELSGGEPEGGVYSGPGISNNVLNTENAGLGSHTITYTYTDVNGCTAQASANIEITVCPGIGETKKAFSLNLFPNPFHNILHIELPELHSGPVDVRIFDINGKQVWQSTRTLVSGEQIISFSLAHLAAGNYVVSLLHDDFHISEQVVKGQ